jgi:hypothetical protein
MMHREDVTVAPPPSPSPPPCLPIDVRTVVMVQDGGRPPQVTSELNTPVRSERSQRLNTQKLIKLNISTEWQQRTANISKQNN